LICTECGLVVADRVVDRVDVRREWRTFFKDSTSKDMCRVEAVENPLLSGPDQSTFIGRPVTGRSQNWIMQATFLENKLSYTRINAKFECLSDIV
jgi:transcription initiation factor TFIIIB Brf1 subunit/transcription initiation factor TFIIB